MGVMSRDNIEDESGVEYKRLSKLGSLPCSCIPWAKDIWLIDPS